MSKTIKFSAPPVVEVALSVQFAPLEKLKAGHLGWYWRESLHPDGWAHTDEEIPIKDSFERFGPDQKWVTPGTATLEPAPGHIRAQFISQDEDRMVQVQKSRFVLNWRRKKSEYPSYDELVPEFEDRFARFSKFVAENELGEISPNQWEISYVNQIQKGSLWNTPEDWSALSPACAMPVETSDLSPESFRCNWHYVIGESLGRVHVSAYSGRVGFDGPEVILLQFTARGATASDRDYRSGFELGHKHLLDVFERITTDTAQRAWKRTL